MEQSGNTIMANATNLSPSPSPEKPRADFLGIVQRLEFLNNVDKDRLRNAEEIAGEVFLFLSDVSDQDVISGNIKNDDPNMKHYVAALNRLFPLVKNMTTGAVNQLTADTVESLSPKAYAISAVNGGRPFVEIMCDIVNEEISARVPHTAVSNVRNARPAFPEALINSNPIIFNGS